MQKITPRSCKLKLEVTEACPNLPKYGKPKSAENVTNLQSASLGGDIQDIEQV